MPRSASSPRWKAAEAVVGLAGLALLLCALLTGEDWLARHCPPDFWPTYASLSAMFLLLRLVMAATGVFLIVVVRQRVGRLSPREALGMLAPIGLAVLLALGTAEVVFRTIFWEAAEAIRVESEPLRRYDARMGWVYLPSRTGYKQHDGRTITYSLDAFGYRQPDGRTKIDFDQPTIIFAGESVMGGYGLTWTESIPAQVGAMLHIQTANIAVNGYASDQSYLRLKTELARFRRPVAVVMLFTPMLFRRNIDDNRWHLGPGLVPQPPASRWRLITLARRLVPYRSEAEIRRGIIVTREILHATVALAHSRRAQAIIFAPQFGPDDPAETMVRQRVLEGSGLPLLPVMLDPRWHQPDDWHPNARAAHVMAVAIADRLQQRTFAR